MPRKTFVAGEILTAADVNTNLMDQAVMVFASAAARTTALPSPIEGMVTYLSDSNGLFSYSGAAWVPAVNTASIVDLNVTTAKIANNAVTSAKLGAGTILQIVSTTKADTFSTTSTTPVDITGLSATITPRSTSSKVLVLSSFSVNRTAIGTSAFQLLRGSTNIGGGDIAGSRRAAISATTTQASNHFDQIAFEFLDSPSTTSSTTYKVQGLTETGTMFIGRSNSDTDNNSAANVRISSRITLMEVAG